MIQSTGNNFGAGVISFKDYQNEHEIVLNGSFEYLDTTDEYKKADVLEIYLPDLSLSRSAISGCYCAARGPYAWMGTTCKCWIKNKNTLCIEKLDVWTDRHERKIWIFALFGLRGFHDLQVKLEKVETPTLVQSESVGGIYSKYFFANKHFMLLAFQISEFTLWDLDKKIDVITKSGEDFPDDVDAVIPFVACQCDSQPGCSIMDVPFKDTALVISGIVRNMSYGTGYSPFVYVWLVRDGDGSDAPDVPGRTHIVVTTQIQGSVRYTYIYGMDMDLVPSPVLIGGLLRFGLSNNAEVTFTVPEVPDGTAPFETFLLARYSSDGMLAFGLVEMDFSVSGATKTVKLSKYSNEPYFNANALDTGVCGTLQSE